MGWTYHLMNEARLWKHAGVNNLGVNDFYALHIRKSFPACKGARTMYSDLPKTVAVPPFLVFCTVLGSDDGDIL